MAWTRATATQWERIHCSEESPPAASFIIARLAPPNYPYRGCTLAPRPSLPLLQRHFWRKATYVKGSVASPAWRSAIYFPHASNSSSLRRPQFISPVCPHPIHPFVSCHLLYTGTTHRQLLFIIPHCQDQLYPVTASVSDISPFRVKKSSIPSLPPRRQTRSSSSPASC